MKVSTKNSEDRAILIGLDRGEFDVRETIEELEALCNTLDIKVEEFLIQRRKKPDVRYYLGKGKLEKLKKLLELFDVNLVVADDELTPIQVKNLEEFLNAKVLDRTQIILEIFARHATTEEGKIQVELARLQYELPRFVGMGTELSRLGGGIGTRGPGEKILQKKRSEVRKRIAVLKERLKEIEKDREIQRSKRKERKYYRMSIAGYTNAGKSSLLNLLTLSDDAKVEDKLFATLEPITRRIKLPSGRVILVSDTVGFIRKLPHTIVAAFRATLNEIKESDLLIHLIDISDPHYENKMQESLKVLEEIKASDVPRITVFNKIDLITKEKLESVMSKYHDAVFISVKKSLGIKELLFRIEENLWKMDKKVKIRFPSDKIGILYSFLDRIEIVSENYVNGHLEVELRGMEEVVREVIGKVKGEVIK